VEDCDAVPNASTSMWISRVLSIVVKNMQSYIVAVVWGVAEVVLSLRKSKGNKIVSTRNKGALPHHGPSSGLAKTNKASEQNESPSFFPTLFSATLHTRLVVPQFQNSLVEIFHEAEVYSPCFLRR
jgi:hypothetical protein